MRLLLSLQQQDGSVSDVVVGADATATVGDTAAALVFQPPASATLEVNTGGGWREVDPALQLGESPIGSGATVRVVSSKRTPSSSGRYLSIIQGPGKGRRLVLRTGSNTIGRDPSCDIVIDDSMVSRFHARVLVGEHVEIVDEDSANGLISGGDLVQRMVLSPGNTVMVGDSVLCLVEEPRATTTPAAPSGSIPFNRSPRVVPPFPGEEFVAPEPPQPVRTQPIPWTAAAIPLFMGPAIVLSGGSAKFLLFVLLSPIMAVGGYFQNRAAARREYREELEQFENDLAGLVAALRQSQDAEREVRLMEHPSVAESVSAIESLAPLLWTRRREHDSFGDLRLGIGRQPSRTVVERQGISKATWELREQLERSVEPFATIDHVPVPCHLIESGALGVSGPHSVREGVVAGLVTQLTALHSPADLSIAAVVSPSGAVGWNWLKWLPHVTTEGHPLGLQSLAETAGGVATLTAEIAGLIERRTEAGTDGNNDPLLVVVVEDDAPFVRSTMVDLAERGPAVGVHVVWCADRTAQLPAVCRTFLEVTADSTGAATGKVREGERVWPVITESVDRSTAAWLARRLAPVVDSSISTASESDIPARVSLVGEMGLEMTSSPDFIIERWRESGSLREDEGGGKLRRENGLRARVGRTDLDPLYLDLRAQGPHALVGGTTGAGKSEFLQTWILSMAARHSPERVTFLFVDYKGGAAFAECTALPHAVGLVTDLSPRLVQRALRSLNAELRYREHILNRKKAKDLIELEQRRDPEAPPSLVIVVDEFAALIQEVPEFVDGVVNVAQRGRSLGLHLILATQRPAGVIKGNLRANTNLRVALRVADAEDSSDIVGVNDAAHFDPAIPGRAVAKTGPGRMAVFQTAYVGGVTSTLERTAEVEVRDLAFGPGPAWEFPDVEQPAAEPDVEPDIHRIVSTISAANGALGLGAPRRPWLEELADVYELANLPTRRSDEELVYGVCDQPDLQTQGVIGFRPDVDGNLLIVGTGGSGKSAVLRSLAIAAGLTARGGPCHVYGLDFGSRGLAMLDTLPHVGSVIDGDDVERVGRLLRMLRSTIDERAQRFSQVSAGSLTDYRRLANQPDEPRLLILLDGFPSFRASFESNMNSWMLDVLSGIVADGRAVGVHVVLTSDRLTALPSSLASGIQKRLVLRVASENELASAGLPLDSFDDGAPAGRGYLDGLEVQVAVLGGSREVVVQSAAVSKMADAMRRAHRTTAAAVARLPEVVHLSDLPATDGEGRPTFGLLDETLGPIGFDPRGILLVSGASGSGRTTTVESIVASVRRTEPGAEIAYLGSERSPLASSPWSTSATGPEQVAVSARELTSAIASTRGPRAIVIDDVADFLSTEADVPLQELLKAARRSGTLVIAEGETSDLTTSWPLLQAIKSPRHGIVLQPEQSDGEQLLKTPFPKVRRTDFPVGRGIYVRQGRLLRVQVAMGRSTHDKGSAPHGRSTPSV